MEIKELNEGDTGTYNVQTETSSYVIDMDAHRAMRVPYSGAGIDPDHVENRIVYTSHLKGDNDWFEFHTLKQCMVGELMFIYEGPSSGMRRSTIVRKISKVYER